MDLQLNIALSTLSMSPSERPANSVESVAGWLREKSKILKQLDDAILNDVARNCSIQMLPADHVLIRQGERGDCFYIVLQGQVSIYICTDLEPGKVAGVIEVPVEESIYSHRRHRHEEPETKPKELDRNPYGKHIVSLGMGASFGELALINDDCIRNASIIIDDQSHLICIDRNLYNRSLKGFQARDFEERNNFVETHPIFAQWPWRLKRQVAMSLERQSFDFDGLISRQGKHANTVYFIFKGTARLIYSSSAPNALTHAHIPRPSIDYNLVNRESTWRPRAASMCANFVSGGSFSRAGNRQSELCLIANGEAIGDLEMLYPLDFYLFTTIAAAQTEVLTLSQKNISRFLENKIISKMMVEMLSHPYYRLVDRIERSVKCPILKGIFNNIRQIVETYEEKREAEMRNREKRLLRKSNPTGRANGASRSVNPSRHSTPTVAPPSEAFRRFITRDSDEEETTLHYLPTNQAAQDDAHAPPESRVPVFPDWETSDAALSALEDRIRRFNTDLFNDSLKKSATHLPINITSRGPFTTAEPTPGTVTEMRRYTVSGMQPGPRTGTLVKVRLTKNRERSNLGTPSPSSGSRTPLSMQQNANGLSQRNVTFSSEEEPDQPRQRAFSLSDRQK